VNAVLDTQEGRLYIAAVIPNTSRASDITVTVPANAAGTHLSWLGSPLGAQASQSAELCHSVQTLSPGQALFAMATLWMSNGFSTVASCRHIS
jgi:hypothetical protein